MKKIDALMVNEKDNVATVLKDLSEGDRINVPCGDETYAIEIVKQIPVYHKVSLKEINKGESIIKYGEKIGEATDLIKKGEHVHSHNVVTLRG